VAEAIDLDRLLRESHRAEPAPSRTTFVPQYLRFERPPVAEPIEPLRLLTTISPWRQTVVLVVALCAVLLGFVPLQPLELLKIGRPDITLGVVK